MADETMDANRIICPTHLLKRSNKTERRGNRGLRCWIFHGNNLDQHSICRERGTGERTWHRNKDEVCSQSVLISGVKEVTGLEKRTGQNVPSMVGGDVRQLRLQLGMTQAELGEALLLGEPKSAERTIRRWEAKEEEPVSGPVQLALGVLAAKHRRSILSGKEVMDTVSLLDGEAHHMGEGVFVVFQEADGEVQTVVLTPADLEQMLSSSKKGTLEA